MVRYIVITLCALTWSLPTYAQGFPDGSVAEAAPAPNHFTFSTDQQGNEITFTAIQNNAPVTGEFQRFSGMILFHPTMLAHSQVRLKIDMSSFHMGYKDADETLGTAEWFDIKTHPVATFQSTSFTTKGQNTYQAVGDLTLKGMTAPVTLDFTLADFSPQGSTATGTATLHRLDYNVGWKDTNYLADKVEINFSVSAVGDIPAGHE